MLRKKRGKSFDFDAAKSKSLYRISCRQPVGTQYDNFKISHLFVPHLVDINYVECDRIRIFSGPYFSKLGLNIEFYSVNLVFIQNAGKKQTKIIRMRTRFTQ